MTAKTHTSLRLPGDITQALDAMIEHRKIDKTALVTKMLRFALHAKQEGCDHEVFVEVDATRACGECGHVLETGGEF